jgi:hypothetical protein
MSARGLDVASHSLHSSLALRVFLPLQTVPDAVSGHLQQSVVSRYYDDRCSEYPDSLRLMD